MSDRPEWKKALQEPNALAWIGLFVLVVVIGAGTLYFSEPPASGDRPHSVITRAVR
jgi:hypothetical protein